MTLTAGVILIGDELLSGRVEDQNLPYIAKALSKRGIEVGECRIVPDDESVIAETVNKFREAFTYVFTTGGIGPTHDDITVASVAKAFGVEVYRDEATVKAFKEYFGDRATDATYRMCDFPKGAELLENSASIAPGFRMGNVFVMAGIPKIMQVMFDNAISKLDEGTPIQEITFTAHTSEGKIGTQLGVVQGQFPQVKIGSYPFLKDGKPTVSLVARSREAEALQDVAQMLETLLEDVGAEVIDRPPGEFWPQV